MDESHVHLKHCDDPTVLLSLEGVRFGREQSIDLDELSSMHFETAEKMVGLFEDLVRVRRRK